MQEKYIVAWGGAKPIICENNGFHACYKTRFVVYMFLKKRSPTTWQHKIPSKYQD